MKQNCFFCVDTPNPTDFGNAFAMIKKAKTIAVTSHIRPDGDAIGCAMAIRLAAMDMGKTADIYIDGQIPDNFFYIPHVDEIVTEDGVELLHQAIDSGENKPQYDLLVIVDASETKRLGGYQRLLEISKKVLVIDHHLNPSIPCDTMVSNPTRASVGEMMYEFFAKHDVPITHDIAVAIYTAVASDTGCFVFATTSHYTHHVAGELVKRGIDIATINYQNFRVYNRSLLPGLVHILKRIRFLHDGQIAIISMHNKLVRKFDFTHDERHKFQRYATDAKGVKISIFITECEPNKFTVSLRSHGDVSVERVAVALGGGGHKNASGISMEGKIKDALAKIVAEALKELERQEKKL